MRQQSSTSHQVRLVALIVIVTAALALASAATLGPATAAAQGDQAAVAVNTKDDSSLFRFAFSVRRVMGDVVDQSNAAVAYASCEECQTVAIAIQVVLVMGDASVVTPENLALAINEGCTLCETLASAYQFVFGGNGPLRFTAEGNRRLAEIRLAFERLRNSDLSIEEIQAQTDALADQLLEVIKDELVLAGYPVEEPTAQPETPPAEQTDQPAGDETATTTTTTTPEAETQTETTPEEPTQSAPDETQTETVP